MFWYKVNKEFPGSPQKNCNDASIAFLDQNPKLDKFEPHTDKWPEVWEWISNLNVLKMIIVQINDDDFRIFHH